MTRAALALLCCCPILTLTAAEPVGSAAESGVPAAVSPWLEEVRAQRQAREARRRASQEAHEARRRWRDPWAAARYEAREAEVQQRREDWLEQIDRDRRFFRQQAPWQEPVGEPSPMIEAAAPSSGHAPEEGGDQRPSLPAYPPAGWNNGWYYNSY